MGDIPNMKSNGQRMTGCADDAERREDHEPLVPCALPRWR
jgi:hypothetical protein